MFFRRLCVTSRIHFSTCARSEGRVQYITVGSREFKLDSWSNVPTKILSHLGRHLHLQKYHPLSLIKRRIVNLFYRRFVGRTGSPIFSVFDDLDPVVSVKQNFDSLFIPPDHQSRKKSDCYYINCDYLLRAHTTAHQAELIRMGLNNFLVVGDVYRRDEIDSTHYPVFHQVDGVRLCTKHEVSFRGVGNEPLYFMDFMVLVIPFF